MLIYFFYKIISLLNSFCFKNLKMIKNIQYLKIISGIKSKVK
jgi:hypothetical protein